MTDDYPPLPILGDLPDGGALVDEGRQLGAQIEMGRSLLCRENRVSSEMDYRWKMRSEGRIMTGMNIGMQDWKNTACALQAIHQASDQRGFRIDRYNVNLDRRMGLPPTFWKTASKETGPMLENASDWSALTQTVPIQPGLGDMMIGSPMSVSNTCNGIKAGVNHIGNMSQFSWTYPTWAGTDIEQMCETVKAIGIMAAHKDTGAVVSSYLDDGFCAQFNDYCSYIGWSLFERYIVEQIIGARLSVSYGGLTHDPIVKSAMILALENIKSDGTLNAAYYGETTSYTRDIETNNANLVTDLFYLMLVQLRSKSGAAVVPTPVTEPLRSPTWQEIVETHAIARRVAEKVPQLLNTINWEQIEEISERLLQGGQRFYENLVSGLQDIVTTAEDPLQLLVAVKRLGARAIERRWSVPDHSYHVGKQNVVAIPTDVYKHLINERENIRKQFEGHTLTEFRPIRSIVASTDIHEYALDLLVEALETLGTEPIVAGTGLDPDTLAEMVDCHSVNTILLSTHNGMALTYAKRLLQELKLRGVSPQIIMGGRLNQDKDGAPAPVDVESELVQLGIYVCEDIKGLLAVLRIAN